MIETRVTEDMNLTLTRRFIREEVEKALKQMGPLKSPGPDGFGASFYQKHWKKVGDDVCESMLSILNGEGMIPSFNSTLITLIPKKCNPKCVNEFRGISLYNVLYKLLFKVLTSMLKPFMCNLISYNQSDFIPRMLITDNIMIAYELLNTIKYNTKGKTRKKAKKLDISKAYNRIE